MISRRWRYPEDFRRMAVERFNCCETSSGWQKNLVSRGRPYIGGMKRVSELRQKANQYRRSPANRGFEGRCAS